MRADLDASLCVPEGCPINLEVCPISVDGRVSGSPEVEVGPLELELPSVEVALNSLTIDLPAPQLTLTVGPALSDIEGAITALTALRNFRNNLDAVDLVNKPADAFAAAAAVALIAAVGIQAAVPRLRATAALDLGQVKVGLDKAAGVKLTPLRFHGVPVQGQDQPLRLQLDMDEARVQILLDRLCATLKGCVVLDGGGPPAACAHAPCEPTSKEAPPPVVRKLDKESEPHRRYLELTILGTGFGDSQGQGAVELRSVSAVFSPTEYRHWSDDRILVYFEPSPPHGPYSLTVIGLTGKVAGSVAFSIP